MGADHFQQMPFWTQQPAAALVGFDPLVEQWYRYKGTPVANLIDGVLADSGGTATWVELTNTGTRISIKRKEAIADAKRVMTICTYSKPLTQRWYCMANGIQCTAV